MPERRLVVTFLLSNECVPVLGQSGMRHAIYAARCGADYMVRGWRWPDEAIYWQRLSIIDLMDAYDRILVLDADTMVRRDAPNLFELVPTDHLGMADEGQTYPPEGPEKRAASIAKFEADHGLEPKPWNGAYYNIGIIMASACHRDVLTVPQDRWHGVWNEQCLVNGRIHALDLPVFDLTWRYNCMHCMQTLPGVPANGAEAYIVHAAGKRELGTAAELMQALAAEWGAVGL